MIRDDLARFGRVRFVDFDEVAAAKLDMGTDKAAAATAVATGAAAAADGSDELAAAYAVPAGVAIVRFWEQDGRDKFAAAHAEKAVEVNGAPLQAVKKLVS